VSVVNPARIAGFARSDLVRTKTDRADARIIAEFCKEKQPRPWAPAAPEVRLLQGLVRRRDELVAMRTQELNRRQTPRLSVPVAASHARLIAELDAEIAAVEDQIRQHLKAHPALKAQVDLLESIPGIGVVSGSGLMGEIGDVTHYAGPRQLVAHAGMSVRERTSGTSIHGRAHLCKIGNARLRRLLYYPALRGMACNPALRALAARMKTAGKHRMVIVGACMRKLLHLIWAVLTYHTLLS
jgi:transposase